jgi:beta-lactamase regulating signal transducer with metallopeptidase domain
MTDMSLSQTLVFGHLWQSVAIAAVLAAALIIGKRMRGSARYGLGVAAFVTSLALPLAAFIPGENIVAMLLKQLNAPVSIEVAAPGQPATPVAALSVAEPAPVEPAAPVVVDGVELGPVGLESVPMAAPTPSISTVGAFGSASAAPSVLITLPALALPDIGLPLLVIWLGVAAFLLVRTVRDLFAVERLVARARPADLPPALRSRFEGVRVVVSADAPGPMAAGLLRPSIVLPEAIALGSPGMAALLEHEHAHIRRHDMLAALAQRVVLGLLWWSPALYWISRRIDEEREVACDEAAVDRTGDPKAFARSLTKQAENQLWVRAPRLAVGAIGPRSHFGRRVRRLIDLAKTGGSPARYSGRLAFAGLAVAVGVAAMVTPRFTANAQQPDQNGSINLVDPSAVELARDDNQPPKPSERLDGAGPGDHDFSFEFNGEEFAAFGKEIEAMMAEIGPELEAIMAELGPELDAEMAGLSTELAAIGVDIGAMVSQDVLAHMPEIMEEVRRALEEAGVDADGIHGLDALTDAERDDVRAALQEAREEMKHALGPELRAEIQAAMDEARREIADNREEIAAAMREQHSSLAIAKEALAAARDELKAARERGDFNATSPDGIGLDITRDVLDQLRKAGVPLDDATLDGGRGIRIAMAGHAEARQLIDAADDCDMPALNKLLVEKKLNANARVPGVGSALMGAAESNCIEAARALINAGADIDSGFPGQGTPLSIAAANGSREMVQLLLDRGAKVDASMPGRNTPLVEAIREGDLAIVKALVDKGANISRKSPVTGSRTPLDIAERHGEAEIAAYLRSKGAVASNPSTY